MRALGSERSRSARIRILSTVRVKVGLPHSGQRFPSGLCDSEAGCVERCQEVQEAGGTQSEVERVTDRVDEDGQVFTCGNGGDGGRGWEEV
ncbi:hypothetical protein E2C01_051795 [Portunus trituberculatus]|uniref:Uncharacterized protein n=1 Tax=Portunus trituberculatus TaxID=210409 RepID=A0A5B7GKM8_PORTR|nr:hypothetical protein [Portunus trituberculatus]